MNYKELIFNAVGSHFREQKIKEVFFKYDLLDELKEPLLFAVNEDDKKINLTLSTIEKFQVKNLFIKKVLSAVQKNNPDKVAKSLIVELNVITKDFNTYIEFSDEETIKL